MNKRRRVSLKVVTLASGGRAVSAPPILNASSHTIEYVCGNCQTVLMHAEDGQVHNVVIRCTACGSYNAADG